MTRAALYARVSSAGQKERGTIQSQLHALRALAAARRWTVVGEYVDDGKSAATGKLAARDGLARLFADADAGRFDVVVAVEDDRFTRSDDLLERLEIFGRFKRAGVRIAYVNGDEVDPSHRLDELMTVIKGWVSAEDNRKRREAFLRGVDRAIAEGKKPRGATPYGLTYDARTGAWGVDEAAAAIVVQCYERVAAGESARAVGFDLEARGVPTPRGGHWAAAVRRLINSTTYRGELQPLPGRIVKVPRLVSDELWYAAQETLARGALRGLRRTRSVYLCEGIARCGLCGAVMWVHQARLPGPKYYNCRRRRFPDADGKCTLPMRQVREVDAEVWEGVVEELQRPDLAESLLRELDSDVGPWEADAAGYRAELGRLEAAEVAIMARFSRGLISERAFDEHARTTARRRAMLERQLAAALEAAGEGRRQRFAAEAVLANLNALRDRLELATPEERREIVKALIPGHGDYVVTVYPKKLSAIGLLDAPVTVRASGPSTAHDHTRQIRLKIR